MPAIHLVTSPAELTTAVTDALLAVVCVWLGVRVWRVAGPPWRRLIWGAVLGLVAVGALLGAAAHGLVVPDAVHTYFWQRIYLSLGLTVALVVAAGLYDWRGERAARRALPWAAVAGFALFAFTQVVSGAFIVFIAAEAAAVLGAMAIYAHLLRTRAFPGARPILAGLGLTLAAAAVQVSPAAVTVAGWPFDHNALFHLVQALASVVLASGVRQGMVVHPLR